MQDILWWIWYLYADGPGTLIKDLMAHYGLSKATIYRYLGTKDD
jgi:DNA-binding IclR family transcriptional regulator